MFLVVSNFVYGVLRRFLLEEQVKALKASTFIIDENNVVSNMLAKDFVIAKIEIALWPLVNV